MKGASAVAIAVLLIFGFTAPIALSSDSAAATVTIEYNWNGGTGNIATWSGESGTAIALPGTDAVISAKKDTNNLDFAFIGWSELQTSTVGVTNYTPAADVTLYAVWAPSFVMAGYIEKDGKALDDPSVFVKVFLATSTAPASPVFTYVSKEGLTDGGKFAVTVPAKAVGAAYEPLGGGLEYYIVIYSANTNELLGYGIATLPDKLTTTAMENTFKVDTAGATWTEKTGYEYMVTGAVGSYKCITVYSKNTTGTVIGSVISDKTYKVSGATIQVVNLKGTVVAQAYSSLGEYEITSCPEGTYKLKVVSLDYEPVEVDLVVKSGQTVTVNFDLVPKNVQTYLGYDLPHFMMLVGVIIAILLIISTLIFRRYARKHPSVLIDEEE